MTGARSAIQHVLPRPSFEEYLQPVNGAQDTEFILAARRGDLQRLSEIYNCFSDSDYGAEATRKLLQHHNRYWKTPLHEAAQNVHVECVHFLLNIVGISADCLKQGDWTPLMLACTKKSVAVVKELVEAGADISLRNKDGWTPFHIACREGCAEIIDYFLDVFPSAWQTTSKNGRTPLHTATLSGRTDIVSSLISKTDFSVDVCDQCGTTPLMDSVRGDFVDISRVLVARGGADPRKSDNVGREPLHLAAQAGALNCIAYFVRECGVNVDTLTVPEGACAAHYAAREGQLEALKLLKTLGADVAIKDSRGRTALHVSAAADGSCVRFLLEFGCNAFDVDLSGKTPRDLARTVYAKDAFSQYTD